MKTITHSKEEMYQQAAMIAAELKGGEVLGLEGELGTGKTEFVRGLAEALGSNDAVKSPSFTLLNLYRLEHETIKYLVHVDLYRLQESGSNIVSEIGLDEWLERDDAVVVIEWPEALAQQLKRMTTIQFFYSKEENERVISTVED